MNTNLSKFCKKLPTYIELRIFYHFVILLVNVYILIEFLMTPFGHRTTLQKFAYFTCLNQISIVVYYLLILKYNIKIYVHGYPNLQIKHCPTFELTYLKTNLSISCFVALSFWMMRIFYPEMLVPKNLENVLHVAPHIEYWIHLVNFIFLLLELIWEKHRFQVNHDKQYTIFFVIFLAYSFILLLFNLVYEKNVYPFLDKLTFITGVLMGIIVVGLFVIFDFIFSYVIQEYWGY